ncbi:MAG: hypothetical protein WD431_09170, partial [Cyclobacteriaceae bacterium]
ISAQGLFGDSPLKIHYNHQLNIAMHPEDSNTDRLFQHKTLLSVRQADIAPWLYEYDNHKMQVPYLTHFGVHGF